MSQVTFVKLASDNMRKNYMGLQVDPNLVLKFSPDYNYVEIPLGEVLNPGDDDKPVEKAMRNQHLRIRAAAYVAPKSQYRVLVSINPALQAVATLPSLLLVESTDAGPVEFFATFRKDMDLSSLSWLVRLYLIN